MSKLSTKFPPWAFLVRFKIKGKKKYYKNSLDSNLHCLKPNFVVTFLDEGDTTFILSKQLVAKANKN